jgi:glucose/arabinose dehydrogenase
MQLALGIPTVLAAPGKEASLKLFAEGFSSPVALVSLDANRVLIVDQAGTIHVADKNGKLRDELFLDVRAKLSEVKKGFDERGLVGLALHPKFQQNRKFYAYYTAPLRSGGPAEWNLTVHLSEFTAPAKDPIAADPASERVLLELDMPYENHHSGRLAFGPDGYLYVAVGDGGNKNDVGRGHSPQGNGQDTTKLQGKILRIDVDNGTPYGIPTDNPFAKDKSKGRPEIYAYGLRNPWSLTFDRGGKHDLIAADVGQDSFEEVDVIVNGGNYGWNIREGFICFNPQDAKKPPADCPKVGADGKPLLDPVLVYKNGGRFAKDPEARGMSITGGYVYRGKALPGLNGKYIFGDWSQSWAKPSGTVFAADRLENGGAWTMEYLQLASHPGGKLDSCILAFGEDNDGELYVMTSKIPNLLGKNGKVYKLVPATE